MRPGCMAAVPATERRRTIRSSSESSWLMELSTALAGFVVGALGGAVYRDQIETPAASRRRPPSPSAGGLPQGVGDRAGRAAVVRGRARRARPRAAGQPGRARLRAGPRRPADGRASCSRWPGRYAGTARSARARSSCPAARVRPRDPDRRGPAWPRSARRPGPGAGRGPDRGAPGRGRPPRLRGQRQPRAQDPGRRAEPARRGHPGRRRRPRGRTPVRRPDAARGRPARPTWCRTYRRCPGCRAPTRSPTPNRSPSTTSSTRPSTAASTSADGQGHHARHRRRGGLQRLGRRGPARHRAAQPDRQRRRLQPGAHPGRGHASRPATATASRSASATRASASRRTTLDRIFERFYRVDAGPLPGHRRHRPRPRDRQARRRRPRRRGAVWSKEGSGSTFTLRLPAFGGTARLAASSPPITAMEAAQ